MRRLLFAAAVLISVPTAIPAQVLMTSGDGARRTISVNGEAEVRVAPDEVIVALGVETFDPDLQKAKAENDARVAAAIEAVRRQGVPSERIKTDYLGIEPRYQDYNVARPTLGYVVRRSIVVTLRDIPVFERMMEAALAAGVTHVHGTDFRTTELRAHRDRARALAIDAAREKAQAMASQLGQRVGAPISVGEGWGGTWSMSQGWGQRWSGASQNAVQNAGGGPAASEGPMNPGQITVTGQVTIVFELVGS